MGKCVSANTQSKTNKNINLEAKQPEKAPAVVEKELEVVEEVDKPDASVPSPAAEPIEKSDEKPNEEMSFDTKEEPETNDNFLCHLTEIETTVDDS